LYSRERERARANHRSAHFFSQYAECRRISGVCRVLWFASNRNWTDVDGFAILLAKYAKYWRTRSYFDEVPKDRKRNMNTKMATLCATAMLVLIACLAVACGGGAEPTQIAPTAPVPTTAAPAPTAAPAFNGDAFLNERCTRCHSLDRVKQAKKTLAEWEATVTRMRGNGAILNDTEAQAIVQYLTQTYGN
jgi:cytochrome c5